MCYQVFGKLASMLFEINKYLKIKIFDKPIDYFIKYILSKKINRLSLNICIQGTNRHFTKQKIKKSIKDKGLIF